MGPAACLFDLDGLLLDTEPLQARAWHNAAAHFGCQLGAEQLLSLRGQRRLDCAALVCRWIAAAGSNPPSCEELLAVRQPLADALVPTAAAMDGAAELVQMCRDHLVPMALVTSSSQEAVRRKAAPHRWLELIQVRVYGDDPALAAGKPAPDPFLLAAKTAWPQSRRLLGLRRFSRRYRGRSGRWLSGVCPSPQRGRCPSNTSRGVPPQFA